MDMKDKKVLVFGSGISGVAASRLLLSQGAEVVLYDGNTSADAARIESEICGDGQTHVQVVLGENANIIFGAMYDDSRSDEATITVIATGLHNVGGSSSKLKARLEGQQKVGSILPSGDMVSRSPIDMEQRRAATAGRTGAASPSGRTPGSAMPTLEQPRTPSSKVKEQSIKIPDFFKK